MNRRLWPLLAALSLGLSACAAGGAAPSAAGDVPPSPAIQADLEEASSAAGMPGGAPAPGAQRPAGQKTGRGTQGPERDGGPLLSCRYYEEASFLQSVDGAKPYPAGGELVAGVVPHHLLAGRMIASFFARAAGEETPYESVIFVGTSHYPTKNRLTTAESGWQTPFGTLDNDREFTRRLLEDGRIAASAEAPAMENDHAISGLIPYAAYYLPGVPVSMVLIQNTVDSGRVEALAQAVSEYQKERRALLICSTDFSHYLLPEEAALCDGQTRRAIEEYDYAAISRFTDRHVDSPPTLAIFMKTAQPYGPVHFFDHSSSERILSVPLTDPLFSEGTTSYFVLGALSQG